MVNDFTGRWLTGHCPFSDWKSGRVSYRLLQLVTGGDGIRFTFDATSNLQSDDDSSQSACMSATTTLVVEVTLP